MSQATYREHDVRSTLSYQERETAIFGESPSGSDYDIEEALSQPTTDDGSVDLVRTRTIPHCEMLDLASPRSNPTILSTSQVLEAPNLSKSYRAFGKIKNPSTNVDFAFFF
jgi:hypothetical protein